MIKEIQYNSFMSPIKNQSATGPVNLGMPKRLHFNAAVFIDRLCKYMCSLLLFTAVLFAGNKKVAAYCTPVATSSTYYISNVTTTGAAVNVNNTSGGGNGLGYTDFTATQNVTAMQSTVVNFSATGGGGGTYVWRIYVDWDQNGVFDPAELMFSNGTSYVTGVTGSFVVPTTALSGVTRMRVFGDYWSTTGAPCTFSTTGPTGEAEDYSFTVGALTPCAGAPTPGTVVATPPSVCSGTTSVLALSGTQLASGLAYQWQDSTFVAGSWQNIAGATNSNYTTVPLAAARFFRSKVICIATHDTAYTPAKLVTVDTSSIPYVEDFESITANNQYPHCMSSTNLTTNTRTYISTYTGNQTNHTTGGSKFGMFYYYPYGTNAFFTPQLRMDAGSTYLLRFWYVGYANATGYMSTISAAYGAGNNLAAMTNPIGSAVVPNNTTYQQFNQSFTPTVSGLYNIGIIGVSAATSGGNYYVSIDDINVTKLTPCTGRPVAGTIVPVTPCPTQPFNLSLTGGTSPFTTGNLTFQWQDSIATGWFNSVGASATQPVYNTSISAAKAFRCIVTCAASGQSDTSASRLINIASFLTCYCNSAATSTGDDDIGNVSIFAQPNNAVMLNNGVATPVNNNSTSNHTYTDFTSLAPTSLFRDSTYKIQISQIDLNVTIYTCTVYGFIDYNHSGTFEPNELIITRVTSSTNTIVNQNFTIPTNAPIGLTRMRLIMIEGSLSTYDPCASYTWGETEDYMVNISYPPCNGPTNPGTAFASETSICKGYTVNVWDTTHEYHRSAISWSWQTSVDGGLSWNPVANSANKDTLNNIMINGPIQFRMKMMCDVSGDSTFSTPANITIKAPYACYCYSQSNGGVTDTSDIGAIVIGSMVNSTGGPHIYNPVAIKRRTDYTGIQNIVMYANNAYHLSIYHTQRNGIHADARVSVFIDYNNNLTYEVNAQPNSERIYTGISTESNFYIDTVIHVPDAVIPNTPTGLRVILNNDLNPNSPANLGCGPYVSGETEDYIVQFRRVPQGVGGVMNLENVGLYPNPTSGRFTVNATATKAMEKMQITVTTIAGQVMMNSAYENVGNKFMQELDLSNVAKGIYFVEIKTANGDKMVQKLVIR